MQNNHTHSVESNVKPVSLDSVFQSMEHWRNNKTTYGTNIPDEVWRQIFQLEETYPVPKITKIFAISTKTYLHKRAELQGKINSLPSQPAHSITSGFSEAIISENPQQSSHRDKDKIQPLTRSDVKSLRKKDHDADPASFIDFSTVVVEFIRADGQRMNIHTTNKSFSELMRVFFEERENAS